MLYYYYITAVKKSTEEVEQVEEFVDGGAIIPYHRLRVTDVLQNTDSKAKVRIVKDADYNDGLFQYVYISNPEMMPLNLQESEYPSLFIMSEEDKEEVAEQLEEEAKEDVIEAEEKIEEAEEKLENATEKLEEAEEMEEEEEVEEEEIEEEELEEK